MLVNYCFPSFGPILKLITSINIHVSRQLTAYPDQFLLSLPREIAVPIMDLYNYLSDRTPMVLIREGLMLVSIPACTEPSDARIIPKGSREMTVRGQWQVS